MDRLKEKNQTTNLSYIWQVDYLGLGVNKLKRILLSLSPMSFTLASKLPPHSQNINARFSALETQPPSCRLKGELEFILHKHSSDAFFLRRCHAVILSFWLRLALSAFPTVPGPIASQHLRDIAASVSGVEINSKQLFQVNMFPWMVHRD